MTKKKVKEIYKILNLTEKETREILQMLEDLRSINAMTDDKCPIDYDMICKLDKMEHHLADIVNAKVECGEGHYCRWLGSYEYN
jgi:hypothetical protein